MVKLVNPQGDLDDLLLRCGQPQDARTARQRNSRLVHIRPRRPAHRAWELDLRRSLISSFNYSYDNVGNRIGVVEGAGGKVSWSYDPTYQLINECRTVTYPYSTTYVYDPVGNRLVLNASGALTTVRVRCGQPAPNEPSIRRRNDLHVRCQRKPADRAGPERSAHDEHVGLREQDDARAASNGGAGHHGLQRQ